MKFKFIIPLTAIFGVLIMVTDELMIRFSEGYHTYDIPILGVLDAWVAWQIIFLAMLFIFVSVAISAGDRKISWQTTK